MTVEFIDRGEWSLGSQISAVSIHHKTQSQKNSEEEEDFQDRHFEGRTLFIGDLAENVSDQDLWTLFQQAGPIDAVDVKKDRWTGMNRGFGFVSFRDSSYAQNAIKLFQGAHVKGRTIRLGWAQKNAKVFIGIIPDELDLQKLGQLMQTFGPIRRSATRIENHFGFVEFLHRIHAERARLALDGGHLTFDLANGQQTRWAIRLGWADEQAQRNCVHVQFDADKAQAVLIGKYDFLAKFEPFGEIVSIIIPRHANERMKGYGFVHYTDTPEGKVSTAKAILALDGAEIRGVKWTCNFGKQKRERKAFAMPPTSRKTITPKHAKSNLEQTSDMLQRMTLDPPTSTVPSHFFPPNHYPPSHWRNDYFTSRARGPVASPQRQSNAFGDLANNILVNLLNPSPTPTGDGQAMEMPTLPFVPLAPSPDLLHPFPQSYVISPSPSPPFLPSALPFNNPQTGPHQVPPSRTGMLPYIPLPTERED